MLVAIFVTHSHQVWLYYGMWLCVQHCIFMHGYGDSSTDLHILSVRRVLILIEFVSDTAQCVVALYIIIMHPCSYNYIYSVYILIAPSL